MKKYLAAIRNYFWNILYPTSWVEENEGQYDIPDEIPEPSPLICAIGYNIEKLPEKWKLEVDNHFQMFSLKRGIAEKTIIINFFEKSHGTVPLYVFGKPLELGDELFLFPIVKKIIKQKIDEVEHAEEVRKLTESNLIRETLVKETNEKESQKLI